MTREKVVDSRGQTVGCVVSEEKALKLGVCDVCSYALRHFWQRAQGERIAAVSPRLVRTYALVPRLPEGRLPEDVSAYEFLVDSQGALPYLEFGKSSDDLVSLLAERYGVRAWAETLRSCYLGYAGSADFSEVLMPWAWGKVVGGGQIRACRFASFAALLADPTPDAGFYLGVKAAFEALLWKREVGPGEGAPHTYLREPAMRYLGSSRRKVGGKSGDGRDLSRSHVSGRARGRRLPRGSQEGQGGGGEEGQGSRGRGRGRG